MNSQLIRRTPGVTGQTSSLQVETATSAQASSSASSLRGTWSTRVDPDLFQRRDHLRVRCGAWLAARGTCLVAVAGEFAQEALGHQGAAGVGNADEEHVHVRLGRFLDRAGFGRAGCSPRTNW